MEDGSRIWVDLVILSGRIVYMFHWVEVSTLNWRLQPRDALLSGLENAFQGHLR